MHDKLSQEFISYRYFYNENLWQLENDNNKNLTLKDDTLLQQEYISKRYTWLQQESKIYLLHILHQYNKNLSLTARQYFITTRIYL